VKYNEPIAKDIFKLVIETSVNLQQIPGQFINIKIDNFYLRRPFSICDCLEKSIIIVYKVVGRGTKRLSETTRAQQLDIICGLGNGFDMDALSDKSEVVLIGGGMGAAPLYFLAKSLKESGVSFETVLGFTDSKQAFFLDEFSRFSAIHVSSLDGKIGTKGLVTDSLRDISYNYYFSCGPLPMLKSVHRFKAAPGQLLLEERMGCGFGACMSCSFKTINKSKRICVDGPVIYSSEVDFSE
jgi:dihydroorotate dehydrogenase electron transfer subunit